jgi:hypothetical protein
MPPIVPDLLKMSSGRGKAIPFPDGFACVQNSFVLYSMPKKQQDYGTILVLKMLFRHFENNFGTCNSPFNRAAFYFS